MNVHSHKAAMSLVQSLSEKRVPDPERRVAILAAAERAFVRLGFHATSMQNVAEEAGMSAGNLYRYFPSKEAIVEALCNCDAEERAKSFAEAAQHGSVLALAAFAIKEKLLGKPIEKTRMILEIWAEAAHNPRIAAITRAMDANVRAGLIALFTAAKSRGEIAASVEPEFAARIMITMVAGLFKRRALEPDLDVDSEAAMTLGVLSALFGGAIRPFAQADQAELR
jgi:TetR/AcrR family transcriptional regulator, repressor for uid operon